MSWRERRREKKLLKRERKARERVEGRILEIVPPEGVPLHFRLAGIGARLGAQLLDLLVTMIVAVVFVIAVVVAFEPSFQTVTAVFGLTFFLLRIPYYAACELLLNGRTLAKKWLGLRTVSRDGRSLRPYQIVVRNLMREVEFFAPLTYTTAGASLSPWISLIAFVWLAILIVVPVRSRLNQRFGDMIAGTVVIEDPKVTLLADMGRAASHAVQERFPFTTAQLDAYGAYELQVLERVLRKPANETAEAARRRQATMRDVADRIRGKIAYEERIADRDVEAFLAAFYRAQRAYLENRRLFGDAREDKSYREERKKENA